MFPPRTSRVPGGDALASLPLLLGLAACSGDTGEDSGKATVAEPCPEDLDHAVSTTTGCMVGSATSTGEAFLGVPYAEPPLGDLRFAAPVAATPWSGTYDASDYGPICPQEESDSDTLAGAPQDEDCLHLNVWRPEGATNLPIVFEVHGGGHTTGSGRIAFEDHPVLADDVILVTSDYRLGELGFLAHPALTAEDAYGASGDQAARDELLALQWVNDNAAALGGDPDAVTVWGFSAGGSLSCALLESPLAAGLLDAVFIESGVCGALEPALSAEGAETTGEGNGEIFADEAGCTGTDEEQLTCLRALPADTIVHTLTDSPDVKVGIIRDGHVLPDHGLVLVESGAFNQVPLGMGFVTSEEYLTAETYALSDDASLDAALRDQGPEWGITDLDGLVERYSTATWGTPTEAFSQFLSDVTFTCATRVLLTAAAEWVPTYGWWFSRARGLGDDTIAAHGEDLVFWSGDGAFYDADEEALGAQMSSTLVSFAYGAPDLGDLGAWPEFGGMTTDAWVNFDVPSVLTTEVKRQDCTWLLTNGLKL